MPFSYEKIVNDEGAHYRVRDSADNRIATCYCEGNAKLIVLALNRRLVVEDCGHIAEGRCANCQRQ